MCLPLSDSLFEQKIRKANKRQRQREIFRGDEISKTLRKTFCLIKFSRLYHNFRLMVAAFSFGP